MAGKTGTVRQIVRFVLVGGLCALVDFACYLAFLQLGVWVHLAKAASFTVGTTAAYFLNKRFTFDAPAASARQVGGFTLLYAGTFIVNVTVNALVLRILPPLQLEYAVAWLVAQGLATTVNFVVLRAVVFRAVGKPGGVHHRAVG